MQGLDYLIADLALILVSAGLITLIFKKLNQPVVLGYIVAGFLTGSNFNWFPTVVDLDSIQIWAEIGIIFLMFALGLEFSFHKITNLGGSVIITAATVIFSMIIVGYFLGHALGWSSMDSLFLGGMISISSTMIILKAYEEYNLKQQKFADLVLGVLILEDVAGVFMLIALSTLAVSKGVSGFNMLTGMSMLVLYLVLWLALGIYLIPTALKKVRNFLNEETLLIVSLGLCLGMVVVANVIGFSSALGAFIAGSILAGTVMAETIERIVKPIKDLFGAIFFVSVGMMVVPEILVEYTFPIIIISIVVIVGQMFFSGLGTLLSGQSLHTAVCAGFSMVQIGEFSFIIATLGISLGVTSDFLYSIVVCVCVITTFLTPVFIRNSENEYRLVSRLLPDRVVTFLDQYTSEKRSDSDKDEDWKEYLKKYTVRTMVCTAALFAIYMLATRYLSPLVYNYKMLDPWGEILEIIMISALMSPFISSMCFNRKRTFFARLWLKNPTNRLPLIALNGLRVAIAVFFLSLSFRKIFPVPLGIHIVFSLLVVFLVERSDFIKGRSLSMETRFFANYNERILEKAKKERGIVGSYNWVDEKLLVVEFGVVRLPKNDAVKEFYAKKLFGIQIIKILRDGEHINMPHATDKILIGDTVYAMGTKQQIEPYITVLEKLRHITRSEKPPIMLRDFINAQTDDDIEPANQLLCCAIEVEKKSSLARKSIKDSAFRSKYKGYIIGIERGTMPILTIEKNLVIEEGDLLWVLGMKEMADRLLSSGLIE